MAKRTAKKTSNKHKSKKLKRHSMKGGAGSTIKRLPLPTPPNYLDVGMKMLFAKKIAEQLAKKATLLNKSRREKLPSENKPTTGIDFLSTLECITPEELKQINYEITQIKGGTNILIKDGTLNTNSALINLYYNNPSCFFGIFGDISGFDIITNLTKDLTKELYTELVKIMTQPPKPPPRGSKKNTSGKSNQTYEKPISTRSSIISEANTATSGYSSGRESPSSPAMSEYEYDALLKSSIESIKSAVESDCFKEAVKAPATILKQRETFV